MSDSKRRHFTPEHFARTLVSITSAITSFVRLGIVGTPEDLAVTIYQALAIDPEIRLNDSQGRPTLIVEHGIPIDEIFG